MEAETDAGEAEAGGGGGGAAAECQRSHADQRRLGSLVSASSGPAEAGRARLPVAAPLHLALLPLLLQALAARHHPCLYSVLFAPPFVIVLLVIICCYILIYCFVCVYSCLLSLR